MESLGNTGQFLILLKSVGHPLDLWNAFENEKLTGLDPELEYEKLETGEAFSGNELMELGFYDLVVHQDYTSKMYRFKGI